MTMLIAGHETTAAVLTWVMFAVVQQPEVQAQLLAEIDSVVGDREPSEWRAGGGGGWHTLGRRAGTDSRSGGGCHGQHPHATPDPPFEAPCLRRVWRAPVKAVLSTRVWCASCLRAGMDDVRAMPYLRATLAESLRMYPQPPLLIRRALGEDTLPAGLSGDPQGGWGGGCWRRGGKHGAGRVAVSAATQALLPAPCSHAALPSPDPPFRLPHWPWGRPVHQRVEPAQVRRQGRRRRCRMARAWRGCCQRRRSWQLATTPAAAATVGRPALPVWVAGQLVCCCAR